MHYPGTQPESEAPIESGPFWPAINPADIRAALRLDGTVTPERLRAALTAAAMQVNIELHVWRLLQAGAGFNKLAEVTGPGDAVETIDGTPVKVHLYTRAVASFAAAELLSRYANYDSTHTGQKRAEERGMTRDDYVRDGRNALADLRGLPRVVAELV